jgi:hypothetical protein
MKKRTDIDFSKHVVTTTQHEGLLIHNLAVPGTRIHSVVFINTQGILAITGDYGNWIFCREFHPGPKEYVSDHYWIQKLKIASTQDPYTFDSKTAQDEIKELLGIPMADLTPEEKKKLDELGVHSKEDIERVLQTMEDSDDKDLLTDLLSECNKYSPEEREWLQELSNAADGGEYEYIATAMDRPGKFEAECIPRGKVLNYWLLCIFDAFDEICQRLNG